MALTSILGFTFRGVKRFRNQNFLLQILPKYMVYVDAHRLTVLENTGMKIHTLFFRVFKFLSS